MSPALQIAWREYKQYVLSRGFLIFLALFPLGVLFAAATASFAEKTRPDRHFVVVDQSGGYAEAIDKEIELRRARRLVSEWSAYLRLAADEDEIRDAIERGELAQALAPDDTSLAGAQAFEAAGGVEAAREALRPLLRAGAPAFEPRKQTLIRLPAPPDVSEAPDLQSAAERLRPYLLGEKTLPGADGAPVGLFAAVLIPDGFSAALEDGDDDPRAAQYWSRNLTDDSLREAISRALTSALRRDKIAGLGLDAAVFDDIVDTEAPLAAFRPDRAEEEAALGLRDQLEIILPGVLTYMLVFIIMGIGNLLLTNTIEERSNKIVEVLLSSVTAEELMIGKLIGIGAVGLTLPTAFIVGGVSLGLVLPGSADVMAGVVETLFATPLFAVYIFYFFCAYIIFAMIFLAIGAISNSLQDAQSYMGPVTLLLFAPLPFVMTMYQNPNGVIASVLTWIPLYTPYAVLLRAAADPPLWEIAGATALMLFFAWRLARVMGRIFRRALLQSTPPKARDIIKLARRRAD